MATFNTRTIDGPSWFTPLTAFANARVGSARLRRSSYRGVYRMEGVTGCEFYRVRGWMPVIGLQQRSGRRWDTWMVDDPVHWYGMREAVEDLPDGRILVAGLGLGLMLHHMFPATRFTRIDVVERNADVVRLIRPTLPPDPRVSIVTADYYRFIELPEAKDQYDGVLWDLAVGTPEMTRCDFIRGQVLTAVHLGASVSLRQFGLRRKVVQP